MNFGIRGHDFGKCSIDELSNKASQLNLTSFQLVLKRSIDEKSDLGNLSPGLGRHIKNVFNKKNIDISILGCYFNMIHPDEEERRYGIERFKEHIRFARDFGCSIVATETGNVNPDIVYTEENFAEEPFQRVVESVKELVDEAEKFGVIVGIEAGVNHPIYSPETTFRLLKQINSNNLQIIFDPMNLLTVNNYLNQEEIFKKAFDLYGDRIIAVHAKDCNVIDGKLVTVPVGTGLLNYDFLFSYLKVNKPFIDIIMEETTGDDIASGLDYLREKYLNS